MGNIIQPDIKRMPFLITSRLSFCPMSCSAFCCFTPFTFRSYFINHIAPDIEHEIAAHVFTQQVRHNQQVTSTGIHTLLDNRPYWLKDVLVDILPRF